MNKYTLLTALLALVLHTHGNCQGFAAPVRYNNGVPTAAPSNNGSRIYVDMLTGFRYNWNQTTSTWQKDADGVLQIAGASAPLAAPGYGQPRLAMNNPTPPATPDLYVWIGPGNTDWACLSCAESTTVTAGTGIAVTGTPPNITVTNTAPNVVQTLSIAGEDLTLSGGGGTVTLPGDADGNGIYGGSGDVPDGTVATARVFTIKADEDPTWNGDGFKTKLVFGGKHIEDGSFVTIPGYAQFVAGDPASGFFSAFDFNGEENGVSLNGYEPGGGYIRVAVSGFGIDVADTRAVPTGITYAADYSTGILANARSIPDVGTVEQMLTGGGGVYGGSGVVPEATVATRGNSTLSFGADGNADAIKLRYNLLDPGFTIDNFMQVDAAGFVFSAKVEDPGGVVSTQMAGDATSVAFETENGQVSFKTKGNGSLLFNSAGTNLTFDEAAKTVKIRDNRATKKGYEYHADYSADLVNNPGSLTDVRTVRRLTGSATTVTGATSALANAAAATAGVPVGGPYRWDDGSTIILCFRRP